MKKYNKMKIAAGISLCTCLIVGGTLVSVGATNNLGTTDSKKMIAEKQIDNFEQFMDVEIEELKEVNISQDVVAVNDDEVKQQEKKTYFDKEGNLYEIAEDGTIGTFIIAEYDSEVENMISIKEARTIASGCLESVAGDRDYQLANIDLHEDMGYYKIEYCYYIGEYETTDRLYFEIGADGTVIGYTAVDAGKFDYVSIEPREKSSVEEAAIAQLQEEYSDYKDFSVENIVITIEEDTPCYGIVSYCTDKNTGEQTIVSTTID